MLRPILAFLLLLCSLLTVLPIPAKQLWYLGVAVSEFPWVWMIGVLLLVFWCIRARRFKAPGIALCVAALFFFAMPIFGAYRVGRKLDARLEAAFGPSVNKLQGFHRAAPYRMSQMISGIGASKIPFRTLQYALHTGVPLTLDFYPAQQPGVRPCLLMVHGGSWKAGNSGELPEVNSYFAKGGYQVATINYRLAPEFKSPAPVEDVTAALAYLRANAATLNIDPNNFVLAGRSAGGHIVLAAAYSLKDPGIRGVVDFYGPTDMFWAYSHPDNPLVMDSRKVIEDFIGGTPQTARTQYQQASPTFYLNASSTPTLMVHGGLDAHVHFDEAVLLDSALTRLGVRHLLVGLPWATHGCEYSPNSPSGQLAMYAMERFMAAVTQ